MCLPSRSGPNSWYALGLGVIHTQVFGNVLWSKGRAMIYLHQPLLYVLIGKVLPPNKWHKTQVVSTVYYHNGKILHQTPQQSKLLSNNGNKSTNHVWVYVLQMIYITIRLTTILYSTAVAVTGGFS